MPVCRYCGKFFKSLGIARHETMHLDKIRRDRKEAEAKTSDKTNNPGGGNG